MAADTMVVAALGQPFRLGMLYDSRKHQLIPGVTLWDYETLQKDTEATRQPSSVFEIITSDSMDEKSSKLQVDASLKASFMSGLIQVEGHANYLNDKKTSKDHTRVTLQYRATTKFSELSMRQLGKDNMQYPDVLHKDLATHVVTGIQYGAQAFFVFDSEKSETSSVQDIKGNMKAVIKKIPLLDISGDASLQMTDEEKAMSKSMSCKFHGDFNLKTNPTSFEEAVKVYQSLPELLGENGENVVPQKVWLMPLKSLDSEAAQQINEISVGLVGKMQDTLNDFSQLEMRCNDALGEVQHFPQIVRQLKDFKAKCLQSVIILKQHMVRNLPLIRGGKEDENILKKVLEESDDSLFNIKRLSKWMDCKDREINVIRACIDMMEGTKIARDQNELDREVLNLKLKQTVCFAFTSLDTTDAFLTALSDHLTSTQPGRAQDVKPLMADEEMATTHLYYSPEVYSKMREKAIDFIKAAKANKSNKHISFLIAAIANRTHQGASIYLYQYGIQINDDFDPAHLPHTTGNANQGLNLLRNPNGDEQMEFWEFSKDSGGGWRIFQETLLGDVGQKVTTCFVTSHPPFLKRQVIDLLAEGFSSEELDAQPAVKVEDWSSSKEENACSYHLHVCLLDENQEMLHEFKPNPVTLTNDSWRQVNHMFSDYGPGVRFISFEHGGVLFFGTRFTVRVSGSSITIET